MMIKFTKLIVVQVLLSFSSHLSHNILYVFYINKNQNDHVRPEFFNVLVFKPADF